MLLVVRPEVFHGGIDLEEGYVLVNSTDYNVKIDGKPQQLVDEFLEENDRDDREAAVEFVDEEVKHSWELAREKGLAREDFKDERLEAQGRPGRISMSNVWDGAYEDTVVGTCQEKAITLDMLYSELGHESEYVSGIFTEREQDPGHAWVETSDGYIADPSSVGGFYEQDYSDRNRGPVVIRGNF